MKFVTALVLMVLAYPLSAQAQGYSGVIADGKSGGTQQQARPAPTQDKAGYAGVMSWNDNSGGTSYTAESANIYSFVNNSGDKGTAQDRRYQAQLKAVEERRAKIQASLKAQSEARKKDAEAKAAESMRGLDELNRQNEERNRQLQQQYQQQQQQQYQKR